MRARIIEIIAAFFIILFVYTAISKLSAFVQFRNVLSKSPVIGSKASVIAWIIPVLELVIVALLFVPASRRTGIVCSFLLMAAFTIYLVYMVSFSAWLPCSCGGILSQLSWKQHILFNIFLMLLALAAILINRHQKTS